MDWSYLCLLNFSWGGMTAYPLFFNRLISTKNSVTSYFSFLLVVSKVIICHVVSTFFPL